MRSLLPFVSKCDRTAVYTMVWVILLSCHSSERLGETTKNVSLPVTLPRINQQLQESKSLVYSGCVWSRHQQTLARERYHIGFHWTRAGELSLSAVHTMFLLHTHTILHVTELAWVVVCLWTTHVTCLYLFLVYVYFRSIHILNILSSVTPYRSHSLTSYFSVINKSPL
jgi:hypothetical protein